MEDGESGETDLAGFLLKVDHSDIDTDNAGLDAGTTREGSSEEPDWTSDKEFFVK